jgi:hypothetical protein
LETLFATKYTLSATQNKNSSITPTPVYMWFDKLKFLSLLPKPEPKPTKPKPTEPKA